LSMNIIDNIANILKMSDNMLFFIGKLMWLNKLWMEILYKTKESLYNLSQISIYWNKVILWWISRVVKRFLISFKVLNNPRKHWTDIINWSMVEAMHDFVLQSIHLVVQKAQFIFVSCDEMTTIDN
jgi:hypothetical protein